MLSMQCKKSTGDSVIKTASFSLAREVNFYDWPGRFTADLPGRDARTSTVAQRSTAAAETIMQPLIRLSCFIGSNSRRPASNFEPVTTPASFSSRLPDSPGAQPPRADPGPRHTQPAKLY